MYQSNTTEHSEEDFNSLVKSFEASVTKFPLDVISIEFNMDKTFEPNWACIWNKVDNIGKPCKIIQKNSKLALVMFLDNILNKTLLQNLYRIEDLNEI